MLLHFETHSVYKQLQTSYLYCQMACKVSLWRLTLMTWSDNWPLMTSRSGSWKVHEAAAAVACSKICCFSWLSYCCFLPSHPPWHPSCFQETGCVWKLKLTLFFVFEESKSLCQNVCINIFSISSFWTCVALVKKILNGDNVDCGSIVKVTVQGVKSASCCIPYHWLIIIPFVLLQNQNFMHLKEKFCFCITMVLLPGSNQTILSVASLQN